MQTVVITTLVMNSLQGEGCELGPDFSAKGAEANSSNTRAPSYSLAGIDGTHGLLGLEMQTTKKSAKVPRAR